MIKPSACVEAERHPRVFRHELVQQFPPLIRYVGEMETTADVDALDRALASVRDGDIRGLEYVYRSLHTSVFAVALAVTGDRAAAEDVLQDTFVRVHAGIRGYATGTRPRQWVLAIARNLALDVLRRHRQAETVPAVGGTAEDVADRIDLLEALSSLDVIEREIVVLHDVAGLTHAEIAVHLGVPPGTVRWKYRIGLTRLRSRLNEDVS